MYQALVILHLLGAAIWVGGHIVLSTTVLPRALRAGDPHPVLDFESHYERLGLSALSVQVVTGVWLAYHWVPDVGSWFTFASPVTVHIALKLGLLALTVGLALNVRLRLLPEFEAESHESGAAGHDTGAESHESGAASLPSLAVHIFLVTFVSVLLLVVGASLRTGGLF